MPAPTDPTNVISSTETYLTSAYSTLASNATAGAVDTTINNVIGNKSDNMETIYDKLNSSKTSYENALFYKIRNSELEKLQTAVVARTEEEKDAYEQDSQNSKRQYQINEWESNNKMDTLFISQLLFISLVFLAPLLYLKNKYIIPSSVFYGLALLVTLIFIFTIVFRVQYHDKSRNRHFWNRRRFGEYSKAPTTKCTP
jgi:hypothetical protein